jgi:hypothetical protein
MLTHSNKRSPTARIQSCCPSFLDAQVIPTLLLANRMVTSLVMSARQRVRVTIVTQCGINSGTHAFLSLVDPGSQVAER